jgi:hypothetical protein
MIARQRTIEVAIGHLPLQFKSVVVGAFADHIDIHRVVITRLDRAIQ